ncbi:hypothetical protein [Paenibacillus sp. UNC451MF]|uniref:hypothetical protein n=1 Tax=Paenibacillus sp. UNC451MF TaxID=1449063 RepID=UPI0004909554|nr:hypothetical protein [Paenibacillus sp. UNC451MF]
MARHSKKKKSLLEGLKETIHELTKPKKSPRKTKRRTSNGKFAKSKTESMQELHESIEMRITKKVSDDMQKMKQQVEQELLEKLSFQKPEKDVSNSTGMKEKKTSTASKKASSKGKIATDSDKGVYKPQTDCTFLKLLILSDNLKGEVVVGYEIRDNSSQVVWGIGIHEGTRLGRSKLIRNTKVKSRKVGSERQYYLANDENETLYFSEVYKKHALLNGKVTVANYTNGLADAVQQAYMAGYKSNSKMPKLRM